jgi:hypothetical protein
MTTHPTGQMITDPVTRLRYAKAIRLAAGWEQKEIAEHLGVPPSASGKTATASPIT